MKRIFSIVAGLLAIPACVMAQPLPLAPSAGYDQGGRYPGGPVNDVTYYSTVAGRDLVMKVYTPPNYNPSQKYGVIYAYQGISTDPGTIFADWCVGAGIVCDNLIGEGKISKGVIIVALDDQYNGTYGSDVAGMTINDAIPYIDSHYSTYADADHRGLYGFSWGGMYTFSVGCGNLNTFHHLGPTAAAGGSGDSLFPNGGAEAKQKLKSLFISWGQYDYGSIYDGSMAIHNYCADNGIPHSWWIAQGQGHSSGTWRPAMWSFLQLADRAGISDPPLSRSAYAQNEAENYGSQSGVIPETCGEGGQDIGSIQNGAYVAFNNVDFGTGATNFQARVASATSGGNIEIRLDSTNGTLVGTCVVAGTGGWQTWVTQTCLVSGATGIHNLYLKFTGGSGYLFNVNWWKFNCTTLPAVPATPSGLVANAGTEQATLRWTATSGANSYSLKRATSSGGSYTTLANIAKTNYIDRKVIGGTTYYYKVSALNLGGESAGSALASVTPIVNVPSPWLTRDVGTSGLTGSASFTNGIFTVIGSGADISGATDTFRFVHVPVTNDCTIIARVASLENYIDPWSKAGVMIRESLGTNVANAFIAVTPGNGVIFQYRSSTGGGSISNNVTGMSAPYWVKLVRSGNTFTGFYSSDGTGWTQLGSATFTMASTTYAGLAVASHDDYALCIATFDRVTGPGWAPPVALTPTGLAATAGIEQVALKWTASANATSYNVKRASTIGGPYTTVANVTTTNYPDTRLVGRTKYYYVVSAVNSLAGESDNSAPVNATPTVNVPLPWNTQDIGDAGLWGSAGVTNGVFTINGSGGDIWGSADAFRFVYVTNSSDCTVIARVVSVSNSDGWAKVGIMARDSLDPGAANAFIAMTPGNGAAWQSRLSDGGGCNNTTTSASAPYWVKLVRSGNVFTGYCSPNGTTWTQLGGSTSLTNIAYIGLAVTAHNNSALCMAKFDNVSLPGWPLPLLTADAVAASSTRVSVTWNNLTNATSYNVRRSVISGGPYTLIASGLTATNYSDIVASVRAGYYYMVSALIGGGETNSPEAAVRFPKLTGGIIGTSGSWDGSSTIAKVFDGDLTTYFDAPSGNANDAWVGLDFGAGVSNVITKINYCPRSGSESRMTNGIFQGANNASFTNAVTLFTITNQPATGVFTSASITNPAGFRYVRYLSPNAGFGNLAELEFYGYPWSASVTVPDGLSALAVSTNQINLTWNAFNNATGYTVKRSLTNGGSYTTITNGVTATNYQDAGLAGGTMYYYVVSAVVGGTNSADSAQAAAATLSPFAYSWGSPVSFAGLNAGQILTNFPGTVVVAALFAQNGGSSITVTLGGSSIVFAPANTSWAGLAGGQDYTTGASTNLTGNANFDSCLNAFYYDTGPHIITLSNLVVGRQYSVQLFALDDRSLSPAGSARTVNWQNPADSINVSPTYSMADNKYIVLTFVASNAVQVIQENLLNSGCGNFNCLVLRAVMVPGTVTLGNLNQTYDGAAKSVTATTTPTNLTVNLTYNGSANAPTNAGSYTVIGTINDANYQGSATNTLVISNGAGTVTLGSLSQTYNGTAKSVTATTTPSGLTVNLTYNGSANAPTNAGSYAVIATISDANWQGGTNGTLVINDATPPQMSLALAGTNLTISWPQTSTGFTVQYCTNLMLGSWLNVTSPAPQMVGNQWQVALPPTNAGSIFYRLMK